MVGSFWPCWSDQVLDAVHDTPVIYLAFDRWRDGAGVAPRIEEEDRGSRGIAMIALAPSSTARRDDSADIGVRAGGSSRRSCACLSRRCRRFDYPTIAGAASLPVQARRRWAA
jgi:hypothetical protein